MVQVDLFCIWVAAAPVLFVVKAILSLSSTWLKVLTGSSSACIPLTKDQTSPVQGRVSILTKHTASERM